MLAAVMGLCCRVERDAEEGERTVERRMTQGRVLEIWGVVDVFASWVVEGMCSLLNSFAGEKKRREEERGCVLCLLFGEEIEGEKEMGLTWVGM